MCVYIYVCIYIYRYTYSMVKSVFELPKIPYLLVNIQTTMENHHVQWVNPLFLWPFSIANSYPPVSSNMAG